MNRTLIRMLPAGFLFAAAMALFAFPVHVRADGAAVYKTKCAGCHAANGAGDTAAGKALKVRDLRSPDVQKQSDAELTAIITDGKNKMPAYKGKLDDGQIKSLVGYVRELAKK